LIAAKICAAENHTWESNWQLLELGISSFSCTNIVLISGKERLYLL